MMQKKQALKRTLETKTDHDNKNQYADWAIDLKKHIAKIMLVSFILASFSSVIYGIIDHHIWISFIPHVFVMSIYSIFLIKLYKSKDANVHRIALASLLIYSFIFFPTLWFRLTTTHSMIVVLAAFLMTMAVMLFEKTTKKVVLSAIILSFLGMFIADITIPNRIGDLLVKDIVGVGVGTGITIGMLIYCTNGIRNKFMEQSHKLYSLSITDALTGAYNSRRMNELVKQHIESYRKNKEVFALAMIDMDDFKKVNDLWGHNMGDRVLRESVKVMKAYLRQQDHLSRYGGDEFIIIFPQCNMSEAKVIIERLLSAVAKIDLSAEIGSISFSAGITDIEEAEQLEIDLYRLADKKLYISKTAGKNNVSDALI